MMILPAHEANQLRQQWRELPRPAVMTKPLLATSDAARMRAFVDEQAPDSRWLAHRGRYAELAEHEFPEIVRPCRTIAESITETELAIEQVRLRRYDAGGYQLPADEPPPPAGDIELVLDISERPVDGGELVYLAEQRPFFAVTHRPLALSLVQRSADTGRYVRYLSVTAPASVYRLVIRLVPS